jgi:hypothetical protein
MVTRRRPNHLSIVVPHGAHRVRCPVCSRADKSEKASSLVRQNSGTVVLGNGAVCSFTTGLGNQLIRPRKPRTARWPDAAKRTIGSLSLAAAVFGVVKALGDKAVPDAANLAVVVAIALFGVVVPVYILIRAFLTHRSYGSRVERWRRADARWQLLYYCSRDDVCFIDGEDETSPPEAVNELLYIRAPATPSPGAELVQVPV